MKDEKLPNIGERAKMTDDKNYLTIASQATKSFEIKSNPNIDQINARRKRNCHFHFV
jgi:hypothetical protein